MIQQFKAFKHHQDFFPGWFALLTNPFFIARLGLLKHMRSLAPQISGHLLDIGCGRKPYKSLFKVDSYLGLDIENPGHSHEQEDIDVFYDGKTFPFPDNHFDSALCNQVLEHVFNPEEFVAEIQRVLKPGGKLLLTVPFAWDEHEQPFDYARYSSFGLKDLFERNGFVIREHRKSVNNVAALFQLVNAYIYKITLTNSYPINTLFALVLMFPFTLLGLTLGFILPKNNDFYLDNILLAEKI